MKQRNTLILALALSCVAIIGFGPARSSKLSANAQSATSIPERSQVAERPDASDRSGTLPRPARTLDQLAQVARRDGSVRLIVGLRAPFQSEGFLNSTAIASQRLRIAQTRVTLLARIPRASLISVKEFEFIPFVAVEVDATGLEVLRNAPEQTSIQEDALHQTSLAESVPLIGAPAAWASGYSGAGQAVAILDSGVDKTHPFLAGKVLSEACYSTTGTQTTSVCPGGVSQSTASGSGLNCSVGGCDHGTHVAGIATGQSVSFSGVAKDANLIAIQVFSRVNGCVGSSCITAYTSDIILGMQRVAVLSGTFSIASVNLSLGGGSFGSNCDAEDSATKAAVDSLRAIGIATVIASGNSSSNGGMSSPGCISSAISVGSTGDGSNGSTVDAVSSFSNSASFLSLLAPGQSINSSVPGGGFAVFNGTSMATPHVAGAWAVLKSKTPTATVGQILEALVTTGLGITDPKNGITKPRIRVDQAVNALAVTSCDFDIASGSQSFPLAGGSGSVGVLATTGCSWNARSNVPWISITSGASGIGNGSVNYAVAANTGVERTGTLLIAGRVFIVTQPSITLYSVDDGSFENAVGISGGGTSYRVNRLTPASYPATINAVAFYFSSDTGVRVGNALSVLAGVNPSGSSDLNNIQFQSVTPTTVQILDQFNVYSIPALTINSGDFVVGVLMTHASGVFPFVLDQSAPNNQRSYRSTDGTTFTLIGALGNYSFRAIPTAGLTCPNISNISPSIGPVGSTVGLTGSGLTGTSTVKFANNLSASFTVNSDSSVSATVPAGAVTGNGTISKTGCADIQTGTFTVVTCPTVSNFNPAFGPLGSSVVITGTNFTGVTAVKFSSNVNASFTVNSATQITATVPAGAVTGVITISRTGCGDTQTSTYTVITCPTTSGIAPSIGPIGTSVVIAGNNFTGVSAVKFSNGVSAPFNVDSATQITATVPTGAISGPITISRPGCSDIQTTSFSVVVCPTTSGISPSIGPVLSTTVITGTNLSSVSAVKFSNNVNASFTVNSATQITATVPSGAVSGPITISRPGCGDIQTSSYTVVTCATVNNVNPSSGALGNSVVLTGSNFTGVTAVRFSNNINATFSIDSASQITATVPAGAVSGPLTIVKAGCNDLQTTTFTVFLCPTTNGTSPGTGTFGNAVVISGANFTGVSTVRFSNGVSAAFTINSATQITATVPTGAISGPITIVRPGCPDIQTSSFTVFICPSVSGVSPNTGNVGDSIVITGAHFTGVSGLKFTNNVTASFIIDSDSQITATIPMGATSGPLTIERQGCAGTQTGSVTVIPPPLEADVAPRPDGSGTLAVSDWVQVGRFSVGLDAIGSPSEFQRADCAPRATLGDGKVTVADWVQAGRYSVGLDPPTIAGGPSTPSGFAEAMKLDARTRSGATSRIVRALTNDVEPSDVIEVIVELAGTGVENAISFTLSFDPSIAMFVEAQRADASEGSQLLINSSRADEGSIAIMLALPAGRAYETGTNRILTLRFKQLPSANATMMKVGFDDSLIPNEIVSVSATSLPVSAFTGVTMVLRKRL